METLKTIIYLFGGKIMLIYLFILALFSLSCLVNVKNKPLRIVLSVVFSLLLIAEFTSLYFTNTFIGYRFYIHFNLPDIIRMHELFVMEIALFFLIAILTSGMLYWSRVIVSDVFKKVATIFPFVNILSKKPYVQIIQLVVIVVLIVLMSLQKGPLNAAYELVAMLNTGSENFTEVVKKAGMDDYVFPEDVKATAGKNIIIISLESLERGYLHQSMAQLTPNMQALKKEWNYYDVNQNLGSGWTSGSIYTCLTGAPALFGAIGNGIFHNSYHSNISAMTTVLKKAGYDLSYIAKDATFSATREMLTVLEFDKVIDATILKEELMDKDVFDNAKKEVLSSLSGEQPFVLFISTLDTHFPDGFYDKRMEHYVAKQNTNLKFSVAAADYLVQDFVDFLKKNEALDNTVVYIFPDHKKMGSPKIFEKTGERGLYFISNANQLNVDTTETLYQVDMSRIILNGAGVTHNAKFFADYIQGDKNEFINNNIEMIVNFNTSGLLRINQKPKQLTISNYYNDYITDTSRYIAHAGGQINYIDYTNSLEALNSSYKKGFRLFELDIQKTSDGKYVAVHDWKDWAREANYEGALPASHSDFLKHKLYNTYTPLDMEAINIWFTAHEDAILVTDKVNEPKEIAVLFVDKSRLIMELFSWKAVQDGIDAGIKSAMPSQNIIETMSGNRVKKLKELGIKHIAISRRIIETNIDFLKELKENGIKTYVFQVNYDVGEIDEQFVAKYEMDYIYGMYADKWDFGQIKLPTKKD